MSDGGPRAVASSALAGVTSGATVLVSGFGPAGVPNLLLDALREQELSDLTVVANNAGANGDAMERLLRSGAVSRVICSYPRSPGATAFPELFERGEVILELTPQGTLSERIRAAGAGIGAFYVRTGVGTELAADKEVRDLDGQTHVLERPLHGDVALIRADRADGRNNLVYRKSARNFGPSMAMAATRVVAEVRQIATDAMLDPEHVVTPGIFVDAVVEVGA